METHVYACEEVQGVEQLHHDLLTEETRRLPVREQLDLQAQRMVEAHQSGDRTVVTHIKCWHPQWIGHSDEDIMSGNFRLNDARETIAREYGFQDWKDAETRGAEPPQLEFESAVDAILNGDAAALIALLDKNPSLVRERSRFGHRSTLLHYVGSNGVETYRQKVPRNLAEITQILVDAGAEVNATAEMYGGGSTTIALFVSSGHPVKAGVVDDVVKVLLDAGATTD